MKKSIYLLLFLASATFFLCSCNDSSEPVFTYTGIDGLSMPSDINQESKDAESKTNMIGELQESQNVNINDTTSTSISDNSLSENTSSNTICVSILGEVLNPGVYYLQDGSRIFELINAAGGITEKADCKDINLVFKVTDGMQITIPSLREEAIETTNDNNDPQKIVLSDNESTCASGIISVSDKEMVQSSSLININTATVDDLTKLTGIGLTRAQTIIEYRDKNGRFKSVSDIMNVPGIKEGTFDKIKDHICTE